MTAPPPPPPSTSATIAAPWTSFVAIVRATLGAVATRGRTAAMLAIAAFVIAIGVLQVVRQPESLRSQSGLSFVLLTVLGFEAPLLVAFALAGGLVEMTQEGTLVYLWLRPVRRWVIATATWFAIALPSVAFTVATVIPISVVAESASGPRQLRTVAVIAGATALATTAYAALFNLLASLTRFAILIGLGYALIWEVTVASISLTARTMSIRGYAAALIANQTGLRSEVALPPVQGREWIAVTALIGVPIVAIALTALRLRTMDVK